jgi:hypothetical protein
MDNQGYYEDASYYSEGSAESGNTSLARIPEFAPIAVNNGGSRAIRKMERRVEMDAVQERCKARLTSEVIMNTTALSALGDQAVRAVPSAEKPVRHIVNVYAASSAQRIAERW